MSNLESTDRFIDRAGWSAGPWDDELDRYEWRTASGMPCLIVRSNLGALCGYVGVPPGHPWRDKSIDDLEEVTVHGGVTYAEKCAGRICHAARDGEPEPYWVGFDTAHCYDFIPGMHSRTESWFRDLAILDGEKYSYKDVSYVRAEVDRLADQASALVP